MFIGCAAARRQSVARRGLETGPRRQVAAGFAGLAGLVDGLVDGFLDLRVLALTDLRGAAGLMTVGRPAGRASTRLGSGSGLKCARHPGESWDLLRTMQAVTASTLGISALQSRNASPVQACSSSGV